MDTKRKRSSAPSEVPANRKKKMEALEPTNFCTYWPKNPAFDPNRVLLHRLFFIYEDRTKHVSVGFYAARDYLPLVEVGVARRGGGPKTLILSDEEVDAMAETLPILRDALCSGETSVVGSQVREVWLSVLFDSQSSNGSPIRRITVHFSNFTRYRLSLAHV
jgi:hypothetical protein